MKVSVLALALGLVVPAVAGAETSSVICQKMAAEIQARKTPTYPWQLPGVEIERTVESVGGNMPFHPVLQSDKARLLKEAAANDPSRIDLWRVLLASDPAEREQAETHLLDGREFQGLAMRELTSLHMGRLVAPIGGSMGCVRVSDYYTGHDGKLHIPPQAPADAGQDGADTCEATSVAALYRWQDQVLYINSSEGNDRAVTYLVSLRDGEIHWAPQCRIDADYGFVYSAKPFSAYGAHTPAVVLPGNPHNVFMAAHVDDWGHAYRPYYDNRAPASRGAIQKQLFADYVRTHPGADLDALKAAIVRTGAYITDDVLFFPVDYDGRTHLVTALQGWLRQAPQPNVEFEMYELKDGQAILVGATDTDLTPGALEKLTVSPL